MLAMFAEYTSLVLAWSDNMLMAKQAEKYHKWI